MTRCWCPIRAAEAVSSADQAGTTAEVRFARQAAHAQVHGALCRTGRRSPPADRDEPSSGDEIRKHGHVLTPGRYVGAADVEEDAEPFDEKMRRLTATLRMQSEEGARLDAAIAANLTELGYGG